MDKPVIKHKTCTEIHVNDSQHGHVKDLHSHVTGKTEEKHIN
jgi:hypothetical protein